MPFFTAINSIHYKSLFCIKTISIVKANSKSIKNIADIKKDYKKVKYKLFLLFCIENYNFQFFIYNFEIAYKHYSLVSINTIFKLFYVLSDLNLSIKFNAIFYS